MNGTKGKRFIGIACSGLLLTEAAATPLYAQSYPSRPVRLIVAFAPGGAADIIARIIAAQLSDLMGEPFVVDNRGGAGGVVAPSSW